MPERVRSESLTGPDVWAWAFRALRASARGRDFDLSNELVRSELRPLDDNAVRRVAVALALAPKYALPGDASQEVVERIAMDVAWRWS